MSKLSINSSAVAVVVAMTLAAGVTSTFAGVKAKDREQFNELEDAAVAQAKIWQGGGKARALMSSDGKIVFPYGQAMPKLTCSPGRACDIEMEGGEKAKKVVLGDGVNWSWEPAESIEKGKTTQHVVVSPKDKDIETNVIITTDRRTYHIRLYSPKVEGAYLNRVGFYYPEAMVSSWAEKAGQAEAEAAKDEGLHVMSSAVPPEKLAFDYKLFGDADFKPVRVFNDGERVYMEMPEGIHTGEHPVFSLVDEKGNLMVVNYRSHVDPASGKTHYVVDKLFNRGELRRGSEKVEVSWTRKEKHWWSGN